MLTLGPAEAEEQLRDTLAIGADRGILLVDRRRGVGPAGTAAALVAAIESERAAGTYDLIIFGNESADAGNYQVAIRVAHALGRPVVTGLKGIAVEDGHVRCEQEVGGGRDVYRRAAARGRDGARGDQPAALPVGAGEAARAPQAGRAVDAGAPRAAARDAAARACRPGQGKQAEMLGQGPEAAPAVVERDARAGGGVMVLVVVEHADGELDELSLQALTLARGSRAASRSRAAGRRRRRAAAARSARTASRPRTSRRTTARGVRARRPGRARRPSSSATLRRRPSSRRARTAATRCSRTPARGSTGRSRRTASRADARATLSVTRDALGRQPARGGASARRRRKLLTVAPHAVAAATSTAPARPRSSRSRPTLEPADLVVAVSEHVDAVAAGVSLAEAKVVVSGGRGVGSAEGFGDPRGARRRCSTRAVGCSRVGHERGLAPAHRPGRPDRHEGRRPTSTSPAGSAARRSTSPAARARRRSSRSTPTARRRSSRSADYAVIGDLTRSCPRSPPS